MGNYVNITAILFLNKKRPAEAGPVCMNKLVLLTTN